MLDLEVFGSAAFDRRCLLRDDLRHGMFCRDSVPMIRHALVWCWLDRMRSRFWRHFHGWPGRWFPQPGDGAQGIAQ